MIFPESMWLSKPCRVDSGSVNKPQRGRALSGDRQGWQDAQSNAKKLTLSQHEGDGKVAFVLNKQISTAE